MEDCSALPVSGLAESKFSNKTLNDTDLVLGSGRGGFRGGRGSRDGSLVSRGWGRWWESDTLALAGENLGGLWGRSRKTGGRVDGGGFSSLLALALSCADDLSSVGGGLLGDVGDGVLDNLNIVGVDNLLVDILILVNNFLVNIFLFVDDIFVLDLSKLVLGSL